MRTFLFHRTFLTLFLIAVTFLLKAQTGTSNGTYNFSTLGADNSAGTGFKTQGDKFKVSNVFAQDRRAMFANNASYGAAQTIFIKAEGTSTNRTFTFKDLSLRNFDLSTDLDLFTLTLRNYFGGVIARHVLASNQPLSITAGNLSSFNFTVPFPAGGYAGVAEIQVDFHYADADMSPDELTFNSITIADVSSAIPLPLSLLAFSADKEGNGVRINWKTANELNVDRHVIERSTDGLHFTAIGSFNGLKNSPAGASYSYFDAFPASGKNYYRLKEIDIDGREKSFLVKLVDFSNGRLAFETSNPVNGYVRIKGLSTGIYTLSLVDISGRSLMTTQLSNVKGDYLLSLPALIKGAYLLSLTGKEEQLTQILIKQ